jgi:ribosomal protein L16 Arg81 hydroxylase
MYETQEELIQPEAAPEAAAQPQAIRLESTHPARPPLHLGNYLPDDFFQNYYRKKFCYVPGAVSAADLARLPDIGQIDELLRTGYMNNSHIQPVKEGNRSNNFVPTTDGYLIDAVTMGEALGRGDSITINKVPLWNEAACELATSIEELTGFRGHCLWFASPSQGRAFNEHVDPPENFIIHTEGTKVWKFYPNYENFIPDPTFKTFVDRRVNKPIEKGSFELTLNRGDFLYVPRGLMHAPYNTSSFTSHLTFMSVPYSWYDYLAEACDYLETENAGFRAPTLARPMAAKSDYSGIKGALEALLEKVASLDPAIIERRLFERDVAARGVFAHAPLTAHYKPVTPDDLLSRDFRLILTRKSYFRIFQHTDATWHLWTAHASIELEPEVATLLVRMKKEQSFVEGAELREKLGDETAVLVATTCEQVGIAGIEFT